MLLRELVSAPNLAEATSNPAATPHMSAAHAYIQVCIFLAALQPYKSSCPRWKKCKNIFQLFSLVMKTKLVQNVNMMSERQKNMPKDRQMDRKTDRKTERLFSLVIKIKVVENVNRMSEK